MGLPVDLFEGLVAHLGIDLGGTEVTVAQHFLDMADIRAIIQHVGGHGVAEQVAATGLADPGFFLVIADFLADFVATKGMALFAEVQAGTLAGPGSLGRWGRQSLR